VNGSELKRWKDGRAKIYIMSIAAMRAGITKSHYAPLVSIDNQGVTYTVVTSSSPCLRMLSSSRRYPRVVAVDCWPSRIVGNLLDWFEPRCCANVRRN